MARKPLNRHVPDIKAAMDKGFRDFMIDTQSQLGEANPKDTGRMSSSWFIGQNSPSGQVRPDNWGSPGEKRFEVPKYDGQITADGTWFLTNNVPYARPVALDPKYSGGGDGGSAWFTNITTQMPKNLKETIAYYTRKL